MTSAVTIAHELEQLVIDDVLSRPNQLSVVVGTDTVVHWASPMVAEYGIDAVGRSLVDLIHPADLEAGIRAFDAEVLDQEWVPSEMAKGTMNVRVKTPSGYVAFAAGGNWKHENGAKKWFVVTLTDMSAQYNTSVALRVLARGASAQESAEAVTAAAHGYGGVSGAQMVWVSNGVVQTAGDLGTEVLEIERPWPNLAALDSPGTLEVPLASDWCYGFPLHSGDERLGTMVIWGIGKTPDLGFAQSVVAPLLDLGSLAIIRSRELSNLNHRATTDHVTGLLNRHAFFYALDQMIERSAVIYVDLDGFKAINDQFGHTIGDRLLLAVAQRLSAAVPDRGSVGRLGGDEFAIACIGVSEQEVRAAAQTASDALNQLIELDGHQVVSGASLGVAYSEHLICGKRLIDIADQALLVAKAVDKGGVHMVTVDADVASA